MKWKAPTGILLYLLLLQIYLPAQDKSGKKFGKITTTDFVLSKYSFDSSAD